MFWWNYFCEITRRFFRLIRNFEKFKFCHCWARFSLVQADAWVQGPVQIRFYRTNFKIHFYSNYHLFGSLQNWNLFKVHKIFYWSKKSMNNFFDCAENRAMEKSVCVCTWCFMSQSFFRLRISSQPDQVFQTDVDNVKWTSPFSKPRML